MKLSRPNPRHMKQSAGFKKFASPRILKDDLPNLLEEHSFENHSEQ